MTEPDPLPHAVWRALTSSHRPLALVHGQARRYPAEVAPFAALETASSAALHNLLALLAPTESVYLLGHPPPAIRGLRWDGVVPCLQMVFPPDAPLPPPSTGTPAIQPLTCDHALELLDLITLAYPGYFRSQTCRMGRYWGVRDSDGTLIAMGGERLVLAAPGQPTWREISGLCTHPSRPGRGLGTALLAHILAQHRAEGSRSWLHVTQNNLRAITLYQRLGFQTVRGIEAHRLRRVAP